MDISKKCTINSKIFEVSKFISKMLIVINSWPIKYSNDYLCVISFSEYGVSTCKKIKIRRSHFFEIIVWCVSLVTYFSFAAMYSASHIVRQNENEEWPDGNDLRPSSICAKSGFVHSSSNSDGWPYFRFQSNFYRSHAVAVSICVGIQKLIPFCICIEGKVTLDQVTWVNILGLKIVCAFLKRFFRWLAIGITSIKEIRPWSSHLILYQICYNTI